MLSQFADYAAQIQSHIERCYGIRVIVRKMPNSFLGDLDGAEIHIDDTLTSEQRLFILSHLFGHTVQWNTNPNAFEIGRRYQFPVEPALLPQILDYEKQAAAYGLGMLHEAGITQVDDWFSRYSACDQAYLLHYYRTGEKQEFQSFWQDKVVRVQPMPVPAFTPVSRGFRLTGVVI